MAVAMRPVPRTAVPVFVIRLGDEGNFWMTSEARSEGGGGFEEVAKVRLGIVHHYYGLTGREATGTALRMDGLWQSNDTPGSDCIIF